MPEKSAEELAAKLRMISRPSCGTIEEVCNEAADMIDLLNNFEKSQCADLLSKLASARQECEVKVESISGEICDSICRWPRQVQCQDYLDRICEKCVVSKCLRNSDGEVKKECYYDA